MSRAYRGHLGRKRVANEKLLVQKQKQLAVLHYNALVIQKQMKGYLSRKYKHDFRARKRYISQVSQRGEELREFLNSRLEQQKKDTYQQEFTQREKEFESLTQNLHHLLGTKSSAGVYGSPFAPVQAPTAFGISVEKHIRDNAKALLRSRPLVHRPVLPRERASLRAQSRYQDEDDQREKEKRLNILKRVGTKDFDTSCKTNIPPPANTGSINSGLSYTDAFRNPYSKRGIPLSKDDLDPNKTTLGKFPKVPFYTDGKNKNKSSVLPNDLFDP